MDIHEQLIRDDDGVVRGVVQLDPAVPGEVAAVAAEWSDEDAAGSEGYWLLVKPREDGGPAKAFERFIRTSEGQCLCKVPIPAETFERGMRTRIELAFMVGYNAALNSITE